MSIALDNVRSSIQPVFRAIPLTREGIDSVRQDWVDLANDAEEPNPFLEDWMLEPAIPLIASRDTELLLVEGNCQILGIIVIQPARGYARLPIAYARASLHRHAFLATPLVRRGHAKTFAAALYAWLDSAPSETSFLFFSHLNADGQVRRALEETAVQQGRRFAEVARYERPLLSGCRDISHYLDEVVSRRWRKQIRRLQRRLADKGSVHTEFLQDGADLEMWLDDFFRLEHAGWKGEAGTSILSHSDDETFYRSVARCAWSQNRLRFARLLLDGRAVAYSFDILAGEGAFALKVAYDPIYARFSPGTQLEMGTLEQFLADPDLKWIDSCADPNQAVVARLWRDRRAICQIVVGRKSIGHRAVLLLARLLEHGREQLRTMQSAVRPLFKVETGTYR